MVRLEIALLSHYTWTRSQTNMAQDEKNSEMYPSHENDCSQTKADWTDKIVCYLKTTT